MEIKYLFRKPIYPLLGSIEGYFIGSKTINEFISHLEHIPLDMEKIYDLVDSEGKGWSIYISQMVISPLCIKNRWTKLEIIRLFNERKNIELGEGKKYSEKSLSSKRLDRITSDLAGIASEYLKKMKKSGAKRK